MADPTGRTEGTDSSVPSLRSETAEPVIMCRTPNCGGRPDTDGDCTECGSRSWTMQDETHYPRAENEYHETIPVDFPVWPVNPDTYSVPSALVTCGHCHLSWDDTIGTSWTPAPSGRCPFEYQHKDHTPDDDEAETAEWELLIRHVNALDYEDAVNLWNECDEFQSHITNMWADEAERHAERLAEEGSFYR